MRAATAALIFSFYSSIRSIRLFVSCFSICLLTFFFSTCLFSFYFPALQQCKQMPLQPSLTARRIRCHCNEPAILSICLPSPAFAQVPFFGFNPATLAGTQPGTLAGKANSHRVFFDVKAFGADNALSLNGLFFDNMSGPFTPDTINRLDAAWNIDSGLVYHGLRFATFYRGEVYMKANQDTVEILRMITRKKKLPVGRIFNVDLQSRGFSAFGLEVSKGFKLEQATPVLPPILQGLTIGITARYLQGEKIQEGNIGGKVTPTGKDNYNFNLFIDYIYDQDLLYNRPSTIPGTGRGHSFDLGLQYKLSNRFRAEVLLRDIWGRIYWKDTPYTCADATSDIKEYDSDGYQIYRPTIRGYESYRNYTQKIPMKTDVLISYQKGPFTLTPTLNLVEERPFYWIDLHCQATRNFSFHTGYNLNYQAFCAGLSYRKALLNIVGSDVDLSKTKAIGLMLSLSCQ
jgi:hypothetical protein